MYTRKVKRKCNVRGCKNTDCFAVSRTRELGNTVIICRACLERALERVTPTEAAKPDIEPAGQNVEAAERAEEQTEEDAVSDAADKALTCPDCGKVFESEKGLKSHMRYCKGRSK